MSTAKVDTIKPVTSGADLSLQGDSGGSPVDCLNIDSSGNVDFSGNTDAKIKLPSAGGIYESDGSTAILTESGGAVTLSNVAAGSGVTGFGGGVVVQVIFASSLIEVDNVSSSWENAIPSSGTGGSFITMANATNKLLVIGVLAWDIASSGASAGGVRLTTSGSTSYPETFNPNITSGGSAGPPVVESDPYGLYASGSTGFRGFSPISYLFNPRYEGVVAVNLQGKRYDSNVSSFKMNPTGSGHTGSGASQLILMEVPA